MLDDVPTLTVIVPVCLLRPFDVALTKACVPPNAVIPTLTSNVLLVLLETCNHLPLALQIVLVVDGYKFLIKPIIHLRLMLVLLHLEEHMPLSVQHQMV